MRMIRSVRFITAAVLAAAAVICMILRQSRASAVHFVPSDAAAPSESVCSTSSDDAETADEPNSNAEPSYAAPQSSGTIAPETADIPEEELSFEESIRAKLRELSAVCPDLIGWLYIEDSEIDYPVVQGSDDQFYLHHAADRTPNRRGAIFLGHSCAADLSDSQSILFGHNMQYSMFGPIRTFRDPAEFERHRRGWLITMTDSYRIDFFSLSIVSAFDTVYDIPAENKEWLKMIRESSELWADTDFSDEDRYIALSTCAGDYEYARALFVGKLVRMQ